MSFIKKNLIFVIVVLFCMLAFAGGAFLALKESGKVEKAERSVSSVQAQISSLRSQVPSLTQENVEAAEQNFEDLTAALKAIREDLQQGAALNVSEDGASVVAAIQLYISRFQKRAASQVDSGGETVLPITTPNNFAFGFDRFLREAPIPEDPATAATLDKQRRILSYLLTELIAARPQSIDRVQREVLEVEAGNTTTFGIDDAISARVPGAIDTMAFSLTFTGYTSALRDFLNSLARFDLPIVVRDIKVKRPSGSETVVAGGKGNNTSDIFELFGGGGAPVEDNKEEWPKPVVKETTSQFTIILEFIEVVLPDAQNQEAS